MERTEQVPSLSPYLPPVSTKVMWFPLWSVALDTCSSEYICVCVYVPTMPWGDTRRKQWDGMGSGRKPKARSPQPQGEECTVNEEDGRDHPLGYPRSRPGTSGEHRGCQGPGLGLGGRELEFCH